MVDLLSKMDPLKMSSEENTRAMKSFKYANEDSFDHDENSESTNQEDNLEETNPSNSGRSSRLTATTMGQFILPCAMIAQ